MNEIIQQLITNWGPIGIMAGLGVYMIFAVMNRNKKLEEMYNEKIGNDKSKESVIELIKEHKSNFASQMESLNQKIDDSIKSSEDGDAALAKQMDNLWDYIHKMHPDINNESERFEAVAKISPAINFILKSNLEESGADHTFIALFHNGSRNLCGIPFMKFDVVAECFKPIRYPNDEELSKVYKNEDIMKHNELPTILFHNDVVVLPVDQALEKADPSLYSLLNKKDVKHIALKLFKDVHGCPHGFVGAYSFDDPINTDVFKTMCESIASIYNNI